MHKILIILVLLFLTISFFAQNCLGEEGRDLSLKKRDYKMEKRDYQAQIFTILILVALAFVLG